MSRGGCLDGFPRHAAQAVALDAKHDVDLVLDLDIPEAEILSRLGGRRVHVASGRSYHIEWNPPKQEGIDDETGEPLVIRPDDTEEAIKKRLQQYHDLAKPLIEHYGAKVATFAGTESDVIYPVMKKHVEASCEYNLSPFFETFPPPPDGTAASRARVVDDVEGQIRHRAPQLRVLGGLDSTKRSSVDGHSTTLFAVLGHEYLTGAIIQRDGLCPINTSTEHAFRDDVFHKTLDRPSQWSRPEARVGGARPG